ncbi:hypothetical protein [Pseudomonas sp. SST3]|uniref:hypothetical protein n=1 Tax=Pseudomonas sp. SST3 TaxID=2267882 RepID=UPI000E008AB8|nr:hypothetical protein [Pseudomonas sp. SST3]NKQ09325.1 hypothetical protein [Pseudomonas sp. SST3]
MSLLDMLISARRGTLAMAATIGLLVGLVLLTNSAIAAPVAGAVSGDPTLPELLDNPTPRATVRRIP